MTTENGTAASPERAQDSPSPDRPELLNESAVLCPLCAQPEGSTGPFLENGHSHGAVCTRCGAVNEPSVGRCATCQSFLPGNQEAVTAGLYRRQQPIEIREE